MSESENSSNDRMIWEGLYEDNQAWRDKLTKKASYKSLGIPDDMGDIGSHNTTNYINKGGEFSNLLKGIAIAAISGGLGLGLPSIINYFKPDKTAPSVQINQKDPEPSIGFLRLGEPD